MTTSELKKASRSAWRLKNSEKERADRRARYLANRDAHLKAIREYDLAHRGERLNYFRVRNKSKRIRESKKARWHNRTLEQKSRDNATRSEWMAKNRAKMSEYYRNYRKSHPEKMRAHSKSQFHKRRALLKKATINLRGIKKMILSVRSKPYFKCYYCENQFPISKLHFDHIVPLSKGGMHSVDNLCASCSGCNLNKGHTLLQQWKRGDQQLFPI